MTREEAINEIKSWDFLEGKEIEAIHTLIPELKESEDERIRKEMVEKITNLACGCFISQEQKQKFIAYLEKQKPSFRQIHDSVMWDSGLRTGIELEKQKENPKSADSIPTDCLSSAKCEDRWHNVKDSLPNSTREVLCKDAIGNFFIGRYYQKSQCWEVMMYDDCDKSNEDNPPVVKWCDIPSEKQKEQKPNIELIQRSWYMEGYHDREFGKEPKWIIKTGEGGPKHELNPRYGQPLAEQRPTEEQLHNLNEAIKGLRMDGCERMADSLHSLYNILKTQEQKPAEWSEDIIQKAIKEIGLTQHQIDWFKTNVFLPKQEWSEEDEEEINNISEIIEHCTAIPCSGGTLTLSKEYKKELQCFIKSLRPPFKPSKEQMEAFRIYLYNPQYIDNSEDIKIKLVESLYNDLKKL